MSRNTKASKEGYFVQVQSVDKTPYFVNVTADLGKPMSFSKPLATAAMRVTTTGIFFSAMRTTKVGRTQLIEQPLALPMGPLAKLERSLEALSDDEKAAVAEGKVIVKYDDESRVYDLSIDSNGIASFEGIVGQDEYSFELPRRQLQINLFMRGPKNRTIVVSWSGFQNKPGSPETLIRALAYSVNHLTNLNEFALLTGIHQAKVPAPPGRSFAARPALKAADKVIFQVGVRLWTGDAAPSNIAVGNVTAEVSLEQAGLPRGASGVGQLIVDITPDKDLVEHMDPYTPILKDALQTHFVSILGAEDVSTICIDITIGDVDHKLIERLKETASAQSGFDLSPTQHAPIPGV